MEFIQPNLTLIVLNTIIGRKRNPLQIWCDRMENGGHKMQISGWVRTHGQQQKGEYNFLKQIEVWGMAEIG